MTLANVELRWVVAETGQSRAQRTEVRGRLDLSLGGLEAYQDFRFMLEHMAERARAQAPPAAPSGYSR